MRVLFRVGHLPRLCHRCNHEGYSPSGGRLFSVKDGTSLFLLASRGDRGMKAGRRWEKVKSLPLWDP